MAIEYQEFKEKKRKRIKKYHDKQYPNELIFKGDLFKHPCPYCEGRVICTDSNDPKHPYLTLRYTCEKCNKMWLGCPPRKEWIIYRFETGKIISNNIEKRRKLEGKYWCAKKRTYLTKEDILYMIKWNRENLHYYKSILDSGPGKNNVKIPKYLEKSRKKRKDKDKRGK